MVFVRAIIRTSKPVAAGMAQMVVRTAPPAPGWQAPRYAITLKTHLLLASTGHKLIKKLIAPSGPGSVIRCPCPVCLTPTGARFTAKIAKLIEAL
ncbi:hypothetical protein [Silvimonas iriomotensis]|uniref:Uncharacterized protein n=1 Tax=Silvimonas iriomotensis TaxID=449662 RepID=A0ABQ2P7M6_9NEIS|nr:hypothetical protein [Silvimonas iriomotensis]GGP20391.1 hypothetical protein GCM10010970_14990 [Silvimonas iriomotensis]